MPQFHSHYSAHDNVRTLGVIGFWTCVGLVMFFIIAPLLVVAVTSFSAGMGISFPPREFSLEWYRRAWDHLVGAPGVNPTLGAAAGVSFIVASVTAVGAAVFGTAGACFLRLLTTRVAGLFLNALLAPLLVPSIGTGIALLVFFSAMGVEVALPRLLAAHLLITTPYVLLTVSAALKMIGPSFEEAALTLGATRARAFLFVTLPLLKDAILAGMVFAFLVSFNHFTVTFFLYSGEWIPLPMWIMQYLGYNLDPLIAVVNTALIVITVLVSALLIRIVGVRRLAGTQ